MTLERIAGELEAALPGAVARDVPFAQLSTYRVGGPVALLVRVASEPDLLSVATVLAPHAPPTLVVGRGSNLLVADGGFPGVAIVLQGDFESITLPGAHPDTRVAGLPQPATGAASVRAGSAVALPVLARRAAAVGLAGLEFFVGIPGSVGGAVRMNAGGHGRETADVLLRAWVVDLLAPAETPVERKPEELELGYRRSRVTGSEVVVAAELTATRDAAEACEARVDEIVRWRREHQPGGANAGSVFRNPPGDSAGRIIDAAGLKGFRVGGVVVSQKHANFFQAESGATAGDVQRLVAEVQRRVAEATGVRLEPELLMVGEGGAR